MRTPEEILKEYKECGQIIGIDFSVIIFNDAIKSMEQYAKQQVKAALEWKNKKGWTEYDTYDRWICISQSREVIDTEQLYKRFEEDKNK